MIGICELGNPQHSFDTIQKYHDLKLPFNSNLFRLVFHGCIDHGTDNGGSKKILSFLLENKCPQPTMIEIFQHIDVESDTGENEDEHEIESTHDESSDEEDIAIYNYF